MKFFKVKLIIGIVIGIALVSGISVYATYSYLATDVRYTINGNEINVAEALNDLYKNKKETTEETKEITATGEQTLDKYYKKLNVNINSNSSIRYVKSTNTLVSNGGTAANENIQLNAGAYILVASGKNSDYDVKFSISGDDSIQEIGTLSYAGSGSENVNGYHNGRGKGKLNLYMVNLNKTTTLNFSISGKSANGAVYNAVGLLAAYELYN